MTQIQTLVDVFNRIKDDERWNCLWDAFTLLEDNFVDKTYDTLSPAAKDLLASYKDKHTEDIYRPTWDERWLSEAFLAARRSHDAQTKCGAALVKDNELITVGYNGWPRNIPHVIEKRWLPNLRDEKYPWMIHAEANAIYNAARAGRSTKDAVMYCTGEPCFPCTLCMWQAGITEVRYGKNHAHMTTNNEYSTMIELFHFFTGETMRFHEIDISTDALKESIEHLEKTK